MLEVFERNNAIPLTKNHKKMRAATLAAVLLHDVGHGPYSHVFEEISKSLKKHKSHEKITLEIIKETEIATILKKHKIFNEVTAFFETDNPSNPYTTILSSEMDADRLDFLTRDRYFTGIQQGQIDLAWLLDSLRIEDVAYGPAEGQSKKAFVVLQKGLGAVEGYVTAYLKLYESIYFHKTTRGIQLLAQHALIDALSNGKRLAKTGVRNPLISYFNAKPKDQLKLYLQLDDSDILRLLKDLSVNKLGLASDFAKRFLLRKPLRCYEPNDPNQDPEMSRTNTLSERLKEKRVWFHMDYPEPKGIKQYEVMDENFLKNITIKVDTHEFRALGRIRRHIPLKTDLHIRFYFKSEKDRKTAKNLWKKI